MITEIVEDSEVSMNERDKEDSKETISEQLKVAIMEVMGEHLGLGIEGRDLNDEMLWEILLYASVNRTTIHSTCNELESVPSGNTVSAHVSEALGNSRADVVGLEAQINAALQAQLPKRIARRLEKLRFEIAMDVHEIPYHGQAAESEVEVRGGKAKAGTTHFHCYATVAIVHQDQRYELGVTFVWADESMGQVVERLVQRVRSLKLRIRRAYLDKGFCSYAVLATLRAHRISYIIPIPLRGRKDADGQFISGVGTLFTGLHGYFSRYTFNQGAANEYTERVAVVRTYTAGRYKRHGSAWFAYAVYGCDALPPNRIFHFYRRRFSIESGYRQLDQVRARTTSQNPALRLLLVGLALILLNAYMTLRHVWHTLRRYGSRTHILWLTLKRLSLLLAHLIEHLFGIRPILQLPSRDPFV